MKSIARKKIDTLTASSLNKLFVKERYMLQNQNGLFTNPLGKAFEYVCQHILNACARENGVEIHYQCKAVPDGEELDAIVLAKSKYDLSQFFFNLSKTECVSLEEFN